MRKNLFLLAILLCGIAEAHAQSYLHLKVISENELLGYAYVFINGEIHAAVDSLGKTRIPLSRLKTGDTISASFVGARDNYFIYGPEYAEKQEIVLDLKQIYKIDEISVAAKDNSRKYFRQYVNKRFVWLWWLESSGNYTVDLHHNGEERKITGMLARSEIPHSSAAGGYTKHYWKRNKFIADSDTVGVGKYLSPAVLYSHITAMASAALHNWITANEDMISNIKA